MSRPPRKRAQASERAIPWGSLGRDVPINRSRLRPIPEITRALAAQYRNAPPKRRAFLLTHASRLAAERYAIARLLGLSLEAVRWQQARAEIRRRRWRSGAFRVSLAPLSAAEHETRRRLASGAKRRKRSRGRGRSRQS